MMADEWQQLTPEHFVKVLLLTLTADSVAIDLRDDCVELEHGYELKIPDEPPCVRQYVHEALRAWLHPGGHTLDAVPFVDKGWPPAPATSTGTGQSAAPQA